MANCGPVGNAQNIILPPVICELLICKLICDREYTQIVDYLKN